jgi:hypothetical protein
MLPSTTTHPAGGNLVWDTLARAFGAVWDFFWPVLLPLAFLLVLAFGVYVVRKVMDVG